MATSLRTPEEFIQSIADLKLEIYLFGEKVDDYVNHPLIRPSINCIAMTYELARQPEYEDLMMATSHLTGKKVNRFTHIHQCTDDLVKKVKMQRLLGPEDRLLLPALRGHGRHQRPVLGHLRDATRRTGTDYHERFRKYLQYVQENDLVADGAMTDPKGDRSLPPAQQPDPDCTCTSSSARDDGIVVRGAKAHQTGACNSHEIIVMPTVAMREDDEDYAVSSRVPADAPGITYIYGRQSLRHAQARGGRPRRGQRAVRRAGGADGLRRCLRPLGPGLHGGRDRVRRSRWSSASPASTARATAAARCGVGDVLIGAAGAGRRVQRRRQGQPRQGQAHRDDPPERDALLRAASPARPRARARRRATTRSTCCWPTSASRTSPASPTRSPAWPQDIAGGLMVTMPSAQDLASEKIGPWVEKYFAGQCDAADRSTACASCG